ncbi:PRC-barrel domain-containing protein [Gemmobacter sp.]|uniref:PRC-barrel domain-containing protein n=1 Tax=Gemmobacter sp. TaxID=1898957 RepID=UPI002B002858|nr:PRC-barrel domain-containing protein [Gemmobacter sp.]
MKRQATALIASALMLSAPAFAFAQATTTPTTPPATTAPAAPTTPPPAAAPGASVTTPGAATDSGSTTATTPGATVGSGTIMAPEGYTAVPDFAAVTAEELKGVKVNGPEGDNIGEIADIELGADGKATGLIADIGGFLGLGEHRVKLSMEQVSVFKNADGDMVAVSDLTEEQLKAMPKYEAPKT